MQIILENVKAGARFTGVAKIMDGEVVIDNVPFNVASKHELDVFLNNLTRTQEEFQGVTDGVYVPKIIPIDDETPLEKALSDVYQAQEKLELKIISQEEYDAVVAIYKTLLAEEETKN